MKQSILITGATSGIGKQLVLDYLKNGNKVYAVGRNERVLSELEQLGAISVKVDIIDRQAVLESLQSIDELDLVICCAGLCHYIDTIDNSGNLLGFDSEKLMQVMMANIGGLAYTIEAVLPQLKASKGRLVALGSASAFVPFVRAEAYGSSKAAVHYLMKTLQISLKPHNIDVSLVIPGFVKTPMTAQNNFDMPFLQTVEEASKEIIQGIANKQEIIEFPKRLTTPLKTLGILPDGVWKAVSKKINDK